MVNTRIGALIAVSISVLSSATTVLNTALAAQDPTITVFQAKATIVHVDHALRHGSFDVNDTATVKWYQPTKATDLNEDPKSGRYQNIELEVFEVNNILAASRTCSVEVFNASPKVREGDMIYLSCSSFTAQASPIDGYGLDMFTIRLDDSTGSVLSDDSLPLKLNLTEWTSAQLSLWYSKSSGVPLLILGSITSLTSSYSDSDSTAAPTPPDSTSLSAFEINVVSTSTDSVKFSWSSVQGAEGYNIYRSSSPDGSFDLINDSLVDHTTYSDTGLSPTTRYYYKVAAVDKEGVESDLSTAISIKTDKMTTQEPVDSPSEPVPQEVNTPLESPVVPSPSASDTVPSADNFIAAPLTPPRAEFTTNTVLLGSIVVPIAATAVVLLWKKGVFRGRTGMETTTEIETEPAAPIRTEMKPENKDTYNIPSIAEEPLLVTTSTVATDQLEKTDTMREIVGAESEPEPKETEETVTPMLELKSEPEAEHTEPVPMLELKSEAEPKHTEVPMLELKSEAESKETEVTVTPMLELKSEPEADQIEVVPVLEMKSEVDAKLKEYFETVDKMQQAVADDNYPNQVKEIAESDRKQKQRAKQKRRARKQSRRVRKQKTRKQRGRKQKTRKRRRVKKQKTRKQRGRKQSRRVRKR